VKIPPAFLFGPFMYSCCLARLAMSAEGTIDYSRDIRPILADRCYGCHGPNEEGRESGLRLDVRESALAEADSGKRAIVPGKPRASEMIRRILAEDADERMPPPHSHKTLAPEEIEKLRQWIHQGADWREHWAFLPPVEPELPLVKNQRWPRTPMDHFVLARLEQIGLKPSSDADRQTLIRRVTFDLTGLPPTLEEIDAFLADESPQAYEQLVNRLLQSPRFGEHMARFWLDVVRFGDSYGRHMDSMWDMWPYRDWVIKAFNSNKPYDEFITEQLAGDLLPDPTDEQLVATGFNRLHVTYGKGSVLPEEAFVNNVVDRVVTTGTALMGLTFECCRCHDHKYDPLTMKDFYSLFAYFNSIDGEPMFQRHEMPAEPTLTYVKPEAKSRYAKVHARESEVEKEITALRTATAESAEYADWLAEEPGRQHDDGLLDGYFKDHVAKFGQLEEQLASVQRDKGEISCTTAIWKERKEPRTAYVLKRGEYDQQGASVERRAPPFLPPLPEGAPLNRLGLAQWLTTREHPLFARVAVNRFWQQVFGVGIVKTSDDFGSQGAAPSHPQLLDWLAVGFIEDGWDMKKLMKRIVLSATYRQTSRVRNAEFGVRSEVGIRSGEFGVRNEGETVREGDSALDTPTSALADSALRTPHSVFPTPHSTLRTPHSADPENRLLARGPRFRLDAEMLRDQALYISGLLVERLGGPSVKPPQPEGLWLAVSAAMSTGTQKFMQDVGSDKVHRRTLYTFIKRTAPPPQLAIMDAPSREYTCVRRERTNTPLQALLLLNDPQYFEAARALAERVLSDANPSPQEDAATMWRVAVGRHADETELTELLDLYQSSLAHFENNTDEANKLLTVGERPPLANLPIAQLAAWTTVGNLVLNLDETLTKR